MNAIVVFYINERFVVVVVVARAVVNGNTIQMQTEYTFVPFSFAQKHIDKYMGDCSAMPIHF